MFASIFHWCTFDMMTKYGIFQTQTSMALKNGNDWRRWSPWSSSCAIGSHVSSRPCSSPTNCPTKSTSIPNWSKNSSLSAASSLFPKRQVDKFLQRLALSVTLTRDSCRCKKSPSWIELHQFRANDPFMVMPSWCTLPDSRARCSTTWCDLNFCVKVPRLWAATLSPCSKYVHLTAFPYLASHSNSLR